MNGGGQVVWNYGIPVEFFPFFHSQKLRSRIATRINEGQKDRKQVEQSSDNRCVLLRTARVLVFESSFAWHIFLFLMLFCSISAHFSEIQLVCDLPTDGRTDGRTDTPSYRDARTHLKRKTKKREKKEERRKGRNRERKKEQARAGNKMRPPAAVP